MGRTDVLSVKRGNPAFCYGVDQESSILKDQIRRKAVSVSVDTALRRDGPSFIRSDRPRPAYELAGGRAGVGGVPEDARAVDPDIADAN